MYDYSAIMVTLKLHVCVFGAIYILYDLYEEVSTRYE